MVEVHLIDLEILMCLLNIRFIIQAIDVVIVQHSRIYDSLLIKVHIFILFKFKFKNSQI